MNIFYYNTVSDNAGGGGQGMMAGVILLFLVAVQAYVRILAQ